jgi:putative ABC transport system permease protein
VHRLRAFVIRLRNILRRSTVEADLREQIEAHQEAIKVHLISHGTDPLEAERAARGTFGNQDLVSDFSRDELFNRWIDNAMRDIRYAVRSLVRTPAFTFAVVLTFALGIGANTAIFSIVDRVLLRPLPYPNPDQLMVLNETSPLSSTMDVNPANWIDWQRESLTFEAFAAWSDRFPVSLIGQGEPERLQREVVSYEFFPLIGVKPLLGRVFTPDDDRPQVPPAAVLSYSLWQRKFAGDPGIIGKAIDLEGTQTEVVGVMPAGFRFLSRNTDLWQPFGLPRDIPWRERAGRFIQFVVGRTKPTVEYETARHELEAIAARLAQTYKFNKDTSVKVVPLREVMTGEVRTSLFVLFAAVGGLLLIACANVANLLVARSASRRREIAIRTSLGAGRAAIVRQLLIESLILAGTGGLAGVFVARWSMAALVALAPPSLLPVSSITIDQSMLLYTTALSVITGVLVGLAPALPSIRLEIIDHLRNGGRSVTASMRLRQSLIVTQVALTIVLLSLAGLLLRSFVALNRDPIGVDPNNVLTMRVELPESRYNPARQIQFFQQVTERLRSLPGVQSVSAAGDLPVSTRRIAGTGFRVFGQSETEPIDGQTTRVRVVTPVYFKTLGMPVLQGRDFTAEDLTEESPQVFVVNDAFARKYFPSTDPLTGSISVFMRRDARGNPDNPFGRIIGVVGDVKDQSLRGAPEPTVFYNHRQLTRPGMTLLIRSPRGAEITKEAIGVIREFDQNLPVIEVRMLADFFAATLAPERLNAVVSVVFATCALLLASIGFYGLLAFIVSERTSEIGIRMALGASAAQVLRMIVGQGTRLVLIGAALGLVAALLVSRFLQSLLFHVSAYDPATFAAVTALLFIVTLIAVLIPARRATLVNPIVALREE